MNTLTSILIAVVILVFVYVYVRILIRRWRRQRLRGTDRSRVLEQWKKASAQGDLHRRILEADAVLDLTLTGLGYRGTLGEKLKKAQRYIPNIDAVWRAHKLRNQIAHEAGIRVPESVLKDALRTFERTILHFCR